MAIETMTERVIKQLAKEFRYFDPQVNSDGSALVIYKREERGRHKRPRIPPVAKVRKRGNYFELLPEADAPEYVKKLEGEEFDSSHKLKLAVRHEAFLYEARRLLREELKATIVRLATEDQSG